MILSQSLLKKGIIGYDGHKKIKGVKLSAAVDDSGLPLSIFIAPANKNDSRLYFPVMERFKIKLPRGRPITRPRIIIADVGFDTKKIRQDNLRRGIKSIIPINPRNKKKNRIGKPIKFDKEQFHRWANTGQH